MLNIWDLYAEHRDIVATRLNKLLDKCRLVKQIFWFVKLITETADEVNIIIFN